MLVLSRKTSFLEHHLYSIFQSSYSNNYKFSIGPLKAASIHPICSFNVWKWTFRVLFNLLYMVWIKSQLIWYVRKKWSYELVHTGRVQKVSIYMDIAYLEIVVWIKSNWMFYQFESFFNLKFGSLIKLNGPKINFCPHSTKQCETIKCLWNVLLNTMQIFLCILLNPKYFQLTILSHSL